MPIGLQYLVGLGVITLLATCSLLHAQNPHVVTQRPSPRVPDWSDGTAKKSVAPKQPRVASRDIPTPLARVASARYVRPVSQVSSVYEVRDYVPSVTADCDACACGRFPGLALGTSLDLYFGGQITNGRKARQVLYRYDFENRAGADRTQLNRFGREKLRRLAQSMESTGAPLVVQSAPGELALTQARRAHVIEVFQLRLGVPLADHQVVISAAKLPGLRGIEAAEIHRNHLRTTRSQGIVTSGFQSGLTNNVSTGTGNSR